MILKTITDLAVVCRKQTVLGHCVNKLDYSGSNTIIWKWWFVLRPDVGGGVCVGGGGGEKKPTVYDINMFMKKSDSSELTHTETDYK